MEVRNFCPQAESQFLIREKDIILKECRKTVENTKAFDYSRILFKLRLKFCNLRMPGAATKIWRFCEFPPDASPKHLTEPVMIYPFLIALQACRNARLLWVAPQTLNQNRGAARPPKNLRNRVQAFLPRY